jgi:hypothetical protein
MTHFHTNLRSFETTLSTLFHNDQLKSKHVKFHRPPQYSLVVGQCSRRISQLHHRSDVGASPQPREVLTPYIPFYVFVSSISLSSISLPSTSSIFDMCSSISLPSTPSFSDVCFIIIYFIMNYFKLIFSK